MDAQLPGRRIMVYGVTGSGKTTLARRLGEITGIPWHSVDDLTWEPGWVPVPGDEQRRRVEAICGGKEWIIDSAYGKWLDVPMARAEVVVALDYPRWFSLQRLVRRTLMRIIDGRRICNGNRETLRNLFASDTIIVWHFKSFARKRERMRRWAAGPAAPHVVRFTSARRTEAWLAALTAAQDRRPRRPGSQPRRTGSQPGRTGSQRRRRTEPAVPTERPPDPRRASSPAARPGIPSAVPDRARP